jgi:serine phosphatase RsbU (regulator of sigma subunit)
VRAYAVENDDPATVLRLVDRLAYAEEAMATAQHLIFEPSTGRLRYANAGHPAALRVSASGEGTWLEGALSPPLGTAWKRREEAELVLDPGDRLVLFTDGLVERRDELLDQGMERVRGMAAEAASHDLEALCDMVLAALTGDEGFPDDVALLAVEFSDASCGD